MLSKEALRLLLRLFGLSREIQRHKFVIRKQSSKRGGLTGLAWRPSARERDGCAGIVEDAAQYHGKSTYAKYPVRLYILHNTVDYTK